MHTDIRTILAASPAAQARAQHLKFAVLFAGLALTCTAAEQLLGAAGHAVIHMLIA